MNIDELRRLGEWFTSEVKQLVRLYNALLSPVSHNASQPNKQPVEEPLEALLSFLRDMKFDHLSLQQAEALQKIGVSDYIGHAGARFVESSIRTSENDPATAASRLQSAISKIEHVRGEFNNFNSSLNALELTSAEHLDSEDGKSSGSASVGKHR